VALTVAEVRRSAASQLKLSDPRSGPSRRDISHIAIIGNDCTHLGGGSVLLRLMSADMRCELRAHLSLNRSLGSRGLKQVGLQTTQRGCD
jgi:hypothetical protein